VPHKTLTPEAAMAIIDERKWDFLDLCALVLAYSERIGGMLKWTHPRITVHIKHLRKTKSDGNR
jgi:hypothetical protein